jgi:ParB family chromosome partitioning protein
MTKDTKVTFLELRQLQINPFQPREKVVDDESFWELVESIKSQGVLEPLVAVDTPAGYQIIAGERRFRAAKKAGVERVPVHLVQTSPRGMLEMAVVENTQRLDLTPIERAQALHRLLQEFGYEVEKLSKKIGKSVEYIKISLKLLTLPDPVKDGLNEGLINETQARAILAAGGDREMIDCYRQVVKEGASGARALALARFYKERINAAVSPVHRKNYDRRGQMWQGFLQEKLKTQASLNLTSSSRGTRIVIMLKGKADEREADLEKIMKITGVDVTAMEQELDRQNQEEIKAKTE